MTSTTTKILQTHLSEQVQPGTILRDFQTLLDFIGTGELPVAGKHQLFPMSEVPRVNARLANPLHLRLERPQLRSYPNVAGLYLILRASGLGVIRGGGAKASLLLDPARLDRWNSLNPLERYLNLFAAWVLAGSGEMVGDDPHSTLDRLNWVWPGVRTNCYANPSEALMTGYRGRDTILLSLFGLLEVQSGAIAPGKGWWPKRVDITDFGMVFFDALTEVLQDDDGYLLRTGNHPEAKADAIAFLQRRWAKLFPGWRRLLLDRAAPDAPNRKGTWMFKVALDGVWRRLAAPCGKTLHDLTGAICKAFDFDVDFDDFYSFEYRDPTGALVTVSDARDTGELSADEVTIGQMALQPGSEMLFTYHSGNRWEFRVKAENLSEDKSRSIRVVEKQGKAPEQYDPW
jgi:hypothetical protein